MDKDTLRAIEIIKLSLYFFYCRIMENVWEFYHKWFIHKGKLNFWSSCLHVNPFRCAYNDIRYCMKKNLLPTDMCRDTINYFYKNQ